MSRVFDPQHVTDEIVANNVVMIGGKWAELRPRASLPPVTLEQLVRECNLQLVAGRVYS